MGLWILLISLVALIMIIDAIVFIGRRKKRHLIYIALGLIFAYMAFSENGTKQPEYLNANAKGLITSPAREIQKFIVHEGLSGMVKRYEDKGMMRKGEFAKIEEKMFNESKSPEEIDWKKEGEKMRRDQAFKAFYQKPAKCLAPENEQQKMDCINAHVRAWKQFILTYKE